MLPVISDLAGVVDRVKLCLKMFKMSWKTYRKSMVETNFLVQRGQLNMRNMTLTEI